MKTKPEDGDATPPRRRASARTELRRQRITELASAQIGKHGFENLSVNALAAEAGISVGGMYRYIDTKTDLLVMACRDIYDGVRERLADVTGGEGSHEARLRGAAEIYFSTCERNRHQIAMMYREYRSLPLDIQMLYKQREEAIADVFADLIRSGIHRGAFREVNARVLAYDIVYLGHMPAFKSWAMVDKVTTESWREEQILLILSGVRTEHELADPDLADPARGSSIAPTGTTTRGTA